MSKAEERTMQRGPAPRLGHSVQHVIDTVRATRARREAGAASADANGKDEAKDRDEEVCHSQKHIHRILAHRCESYSIQYP